jgi:hypothetical protein
MSFTFKVTCAWFPNCTALKLEKNIKKNIIFLIRLALLIYACTLGATVTVNHFTYSSRGPSFQDRIYEKQTIPHTPHSFGVLSLHAQGDSYDRTNRTTHIHPRANTRRAGPL